MQKILVGGITGSGKTTMAKGISARLNLPFVEIDGLFHGPGWTKRPEFFEDIKRVTDEPAWVMDSYGYSIVREILLSKADTLIWLDYPRWQIMPRVIKRSIRRAVTKEVLWNGNFETFKNFAQPDHPIRWAWSQFGPRRKLMSNLLSDPAYKHLEVIHLKNIRAAREWFRELARVGRS
jgi:adenylate kinase family enzyme